MNGGGGSQPGAGDPASAARRGGESLPVAGRMPRPLPYTDVKPVGAADFYYAINATFRFIAREYGRDGLVEWWQGLGREYMRPVWMRWRSGGLEAIAEYWKAFFAAEPGAQVEVERVGDSVLLDIKVCPAIHHLHAGHREIVTDFCQHCYYVSEAAAQRAGYAVRVQGGSGSCRQRFFAADAQEAKVPQKMEDIVPC